MMASTGEAPLMCTMSRSLVLAGTTGRKRCKASLRTTKLACTCQTLTLLYVPNTLQHTVVTDACYNAQHYKACGLCSVISC